MTEQCQCRSPSLASLDERWQRLPIAAKDLAIACGFLRERVRSRAAAPTPPGSVEVACTTPLADGMAIETRTPELEQTRRSILAMLVRRYPEQAIRLFPDKPFHRELRRAGLLERASGAVPNLDREDRSHPYIAVDMTRCIDCDRCVRICAAEYKVTAVHVTAR